MNAQRMEKMESTECVLCVSNAPMLEPRPMGPAEVRALRGEASRATFARRLGVTPLTVYRWELPSHAAEARSPRAHHLAALYGLANPEARIVSGQAIEAALLSDVHLLLAHAFWDAAERKGLAYVAHTRKVLAETRAAISTAVAQARAIGYLDARGAFLIVSPVIANRKTPPWIAARAHIVAAIARSAVGEPHFDHQGVAMHIAQARALSPVSDLRALAAAVEIEALGRDVDLRSVTRASALATADFAGASEPVTRCLVEEAQATIARAAGDRNAEGAHLVTALQAARDLSFVAAESRLRTKLARAASTNSSQK